MRMAGVAMTRVYKAKILDVERRENQIGECQMGACGRIHKWEWLGDMACVWRGVGMKVKVV